MSLIKSLFKEAFGLIVDDIGFAASIIAWILVVWLLHAAWVDESWAGLVFFLGLAVNLVVSVSVSCEKA